MTMVGIRSDLKKISLLSGGNLPSRKMSAELKGFALCCRNLNNDLKL